MSDDAMFRGDCGRCDALCCVALSFDAGVHFAFDKPAGEGCRHLEATRCTIHSRLPQAGMAGCAAYDCLGAGQLVTAMFADADAAVPSTRRAIDRAFALARQVQAMRLALRRAGVEGPSERLLAAATASYPALLCFDLGQARRAVALALGRRAPAGAVRLEQR